MISISLPVKMPWIVKKLYPHYLWDKKAESAGKKLLYLTFDDGPIPEITPWVLQTLADYNARASFFMIGDNIRKHPDIFKAVVTAGHTIGNHTYHHLKGSKTDRIEYIANVQKTQEELIKALRTIGRKKINLDSKPCYFRPPYGKLTRKQARHLQKDYTIVLYDVLAYDWEEKISPAQCKENILKNTESGSIILMHDSIKASKNLKAFLPEVLAHFTALGYSFEAL